MYNETQIQVFKALGADKPKDQRLPMYQLVRKILTHWCPLYLKIESYEDIKADGLYLDILISKPISHILTLTDSAFLPPLDSSARDMYTRRQGVPGYLAIITHLGYENFFPEHYRGTKSMLSAFRHVPLPSLGADTREIVQWSILHTLSNKSSPIYHALKDGQLTNPYWLVNEASETLFDRNITQ